MGPCRNNGLRGLVPELHRFPTQSLHCQGSSFAAASRLPSILASGPFPATSREITPHFFSLEKWWLKMTMPLVRAQIRGGSSTSEQCDGPRWEAVKQSAFHEGGRDLAETVLDDV
jgi:hypothetical protein